MNTPNPDMYADPWVRVPTATSQPQDWDTGETREFANIFGDQEISYFSFTENELVDVDADALPMDQDEPLGGSPDDTDRKIIHNVKKYVANEQLGASEAEGRDAFLDFVSAVNPDADYKVKEWQACSEGQQDFRFDSCAPQTFSIYHQEPPASPDSPSSEESRETQSYVPSEATDSTFKPNPEDASSDSSLDFMDEIFSPESTPPKRKRGRPSAASAKSNQNVGRPGPGRRSTIVNTPCPEHPTFVRKIKFERVQRRPPTAPRVPSPKYYETTDYGWEYSENNDLAPVEQIVDACMDLPEDPAFYPLLLRFGVDG